MSKPEDTPINEVRYLTDDRDHKKRNELVISCGGNGDWYVAVVPEGEGAVGRAVRICTSGGASSAAPGLGVAVSQAFHALLIATTKPPPLSPVRMNRDLKVIDSHIVHATADGCVWRVNPEWESAPFERRVLTEKEIRFHKHLNAGDLNPNDEVLVCRKAAEVIARYKD